VGVSRRTITRRRRREGEREIERNNKKIKETRDNSKEMMAARLVGRLVGRSFVRSSVSQSSQPAREARRKSVKLGRKAKAGSPRSPRFDSGPRFRARPGRMCTNYSGISVYLQASCAVAVPAMYSVLKYSSTAVLG
jgi:hypothetical protein